MGHGVRYDRCSIGRGEALIDQNRIREALEDPAGFDPDELREFIGADLMDVPVDRRFKERLREELWDMVRRRYGPVPRDPS